MSREEVKPWDIPWTFTVEWDTEVGKIPAPILRLFTYRSVVTPGRCSKETDRGHAEYYVRAVEGYVAKYCSDRTDITATAAETTP